jgi:cytochrome c oxidase subunit 2
MTGFLIIVILALISIAVWQLTKIFELTSSVKGNVEDSQIANDNDNKVNGNLMFAFLGFIYLITIYSFYKWGGLVLSDPASEHGLIVDNLMNISFALIFFVQTITQALLHYFSFKYSGKAGQKAVYYSDNTKLEIIWSSIPAITLAGLILYGLYGWTEIMFVDEKDDTIVIEIYAKQFGWEARYSGKDNVLGKANVRYIEGVNTLGVDVNDPNAQDDIVTNELHLPKGKRVVFKFRSQDVLHSAYMPHFRAQMNCVPGMVTQFSFIPNQTTDDMRAKQHIIDKVKNINSIRSEKSKELVSKGLPALDNYIFDYLLLCNKICGASHYNMQMKIVVEDLSTFNKWLNTKEKLVKVIKASNEPVIDTNTLTLPNVIDTAILTNKTDTTKTIIN